jgi:hypothetical protein
MENNVLVPFESEPTGHGVEYLIRISVWNGKDGYEGPFNLRDVQNIAAEEGEETAQYMNRVVVPKYGPVIDHAGDGIFGYSQFYSLQNNINYNNTRLLAKYGALLRIENDDFCIWQVLVALKDELRPDRMGLNSFRVRRAWVCFSGSEEKAFKLYSMKRFLQRLTTHGK